MNYSKKSKIFALLTCFAVFAAFCGGIAYADSWQLPDVTLDDLAIGYKWVIRTDGGYHWAVADNGSSAFLSTNASYTINSALSALTTGRTWYENILVKGSYTLDSSLKPGSWTHLVVNAKFTLGDAVNFPLLNCTNIEQIHVEGGFWDGRGSRQSSSGLAALLFSGCGNVTLRNAEVVDGRYYGVKFSTSEFYMDNCVVRNCTAYTWSCGVVVAGSYVVGGTSTRKEISHCRIWGSVQNVYLDNSAIWDFMLVDNWINGGSYGLVSEAGNTMSDIVVTRNYFDSQTVYAIYAKGANNWRIENNRIEESGQHSIRMTLIEKRNLIANNEIYDSGCLGNNQYDGIYIDSISAESGLDEHYESLVIHDNNICCKHTVSYGTSHNARYAINIQPTLDQLWVFNNYIEGQTAAHNYTAGSNNYWDGNIEGVIASGTVTYTVP